MATKKKQPGRPKSADKVKMMSAYLRKSEINRINKKYENLTEAVRAEVLPKCG